MAAASREANVYKAKLAEQAERYEEMVEFMEKVTASAGASDELTGEERNLLSVAYKNVIGARRASWRIVSSIEQKEESRGNEGHVAAIREYRGRIESELASICGGILRLLSDHLVPSAAAGDSKVFYLKMKGDYHRYLAEFKSGAERKEAAESTLAAYKSAQEIALEQLAPTHPIRLGLALNFSVFYYEILNSPDKACSLAKQRPIPVETETGFPSKMQAAKPRSSSSEMAHKASASASSNSKASTVKTTKGTLDSSDGKPNKVLERKSSSKDNSLPEKRIVGVLEIQQQVAKLQEEVKKAREEKSRALRELVEAKNSMKRKEKEISEHSNNRLRMLELELGNAKASQGNMLDSLVSQTKQLEQTKILLEEAKLKIMSLQEGAVDSAGRSSFGNHVDEIGLLRNELKLAMEAEAKSKKAMDDLAIALKEVTTENHRVKDRLSSTQSESEKARAEVERLKALLKTADDKFREANVNSERAKLEMEESMASWTPKESGFINCMRAFEEKISKVTEERDILIHSQRVSREDTSRLRDVMKQALNEATVATEALEIARAENSQLKDLASEKENALQRIKQEYECLIVSEAAALDSVRELKNLLAATSMDSERVVKFPSDNWRIENPRAQNGPRHSMGELGMFKVSIYDQEQKDRRTASGSNLADSMLPSEDGESLTLDDFDHIDMNQFHGVEPEREFPMKQKKKMPMLRRFGDMLRRSSFHK